MKRALMVGLILVLVSLVGAQTTVPGGGGGGAVTITGGTTATSGCLDGAPLKSSSNTAVCTKMDLTKFVTADQADSAGAFIDITDLTFSVAANTVYVLDCNFIASSAAATTGIQIGINGPASPTNLQLSVVFGLSGTSAAYTSIAAYDTIPAASGTASGGATPITNLLSGTFENGANAGTLALRFRTEIGASAVTIKRGSFCRVWTP